MLTLINTNRMTPPIAPIGLDYVAGSARRAGIDTEVLDLCLSDSPTAAMCDYFGRNQPRLVGLSFRNSDDSFWPSAQWFVPELAETVAAVREHTDAPIVLGGTGYSIFPERTLEATGAEFGVCGDGEAAIVALYRQVTGRRRFGSVPGLIWKEEGRLPRNPPAWGGEMNLPVARDAVDNAAYFRLGGQMGLETKRGCPSRCVFCADVLAKGARPRLRDPDEVAEEAAGLYERGIDVLHTCDSEFNIPPDHALAICREFMRRGLGSRGRWYAYLAVAPFDAELAAALRRAGCAGVNFTGPVGCDEMLAALDQPHRCEDIARAVRLCRENGIAVMIDLMLGAPGETPRTVAATIEFCKRADADCVGVGLGVRLYPRLEMARRVAAEGQMESNPAVRRNYDGSVDLFKPTYYVSAALGPRPASLVRDCIAGDARFFPPADEAPAGGHADGDHNYNQNLPLVRAIAGGARGAYWDILRKLPR